jgi:hypothetical protein
MVLITDVINVLAAYNQAFNTKEIMEQNLKHMIELFDLYFYQKYIPSFAHLLFPAYNMGVPL